MTGLQVTTTWRSPLASAFQVQILSLQGLWLDTCIASPHTYSVFVSPGPQRKQKEEIETELNMQEVWNKRENEGEARRRWRVACGADVALSEGQRKAGGWGGNALDNPKFGRAAQGSLSPNCPAGLCHRLGAARDQGGAQAVPSFREQLVGPLVSYAP